MSSTKRRHLCADHPHYAGVRKPTNGCEVCMGIWNRVNRAEELYLDGLFKRTVKRDPER